MPFGFDPNDTQRILNTVEDNPYIRSFIEVMLICTKNGDLVLISFTWVSSEYTIDKVLECQKESTLKYGTGGLRYQCEVAGKKFYLYYTGDPQCL